MQKTVVVGFRSAEQSELEPSEVSAFNAEILTRLDGNSYPGVTVQTEDLAATDIWMRRTERPSRRVAAVVAVWTLPGQEVGDVGRIAADLWPDQVRCVVEETVVRRKPGQSSDATTPVPGRTMTSLLYRSPSQTHEEHLQHWAEVHQPLSLRIHPQHTYVRNAVIGDQSAAGIDFDAISEEGFASVADIVEPARFFGADVTTSTWRENASTIGADIKLFLDRRRTTATVMFEYRLREVTGQ
jgi:EthD domain